MAYVHAKNAKQKVLEDINVYSFRIYFLDTLICSARRATLSIIIVKAVPIQNAPKGDLLYKSFTIQINVSFRNCFVMFICNFMKFLYSHNKSNLDWGSIGRYPAGHQKPDNCDH